MKNLIITISMVILCSFFLQFQIDVNLLERQTLKVKYTADRMACAAAMLTDEESFGQGLTVFTCPEGAALALECLKGSLGYGDYYQPIQNTYFTETASADLYFFDDTLVMRHYRNGAYIGSSDFLYGDSLSLYVAPGQNDPSMLIDRPTVVCVLDVGRPSIRSAIAPGKLSVVQRSVYEYR